MKFTHGSIMAEAMNRLLADNDLTYGKVVAHIMEHGLYARSPETASQWYVYNQALGTLNPATVDEIRSADYLDSHVETFLRYWAKSVAA